MTLIRGFFFITIFSLTLILVSCSQVPEKAPEGKRDIAMITDPEGDGPPCGTVGTIAERISNCKASVSSKYVNGRFVSVGRIDLVTRTKDFKNVWINPRTGMLWTDFLKLPDNSFEYALQACRPDLPEMAGISGVNWKLPSVQDYDSTDTDAMVREYQFGDEYCKWTSTRSNALDRLGRREAWAYYNGTNIEVSLNIDERCAVRCVGRKP